LTLAPDGGKSPKKLPNSNNNSVNSFYSSLGSVNIENYYLHKKEKSFMELQKSLIEKAWDEEIVRDILKLLRSYMEVEISNRNWIRFFFIYRYFYLLSLYFFSCYPIDSDKNGFISLGIEDNIGQKMKLQIFFHRNLYLINTIMKNLLIYQAFDFDSLVKIHEITFRINRKLELFYIFLSQEHHISLQEVFSRRSSEKKDFTQGEIELFIKQAFQLLQWLNSRSYFLNEFLFENVFCCLKSIGSKSNNPIEFKYDLLPRFDRLLYEKIEANMDLASISKRNNLSICSIAISLITMIEHEELKKIKSSKILLSFLKNNRTFHQNLSFFLQTFFEDNLLGYNLEQSNQFYLECIQNSIESLNKPKLFKEKASVFAIKPDYEYLYYFKDEILYFYLENENKTRAFRLLHSDFQDSLLIYAHFLDEANILHYIFSFKDYNICNYSRLSLEDSQLTQENLLILKEMFKLLLSENKAKKGLDKIFKTSVFSLKELKVLLKLEPSDQKNEAFSNELTSIFMKIIPFNEKNDENLIMSLEFLYNLYDIAHNFTDITPLGIKILYIFDKFYYPSQIQAFNNELFVFGGNLKQFPSSFFLRISNEKNSEKLQDLPFACKNSHVFLDKTKEKFIWLSLIKKNLHVFAYNIKENSSWVQLNFDRNVKLEDNISLFIANPIKSKAWFFTKKIGFSLDFEKHEVVSLELKSQAFLLENSDFMMNFRVRKNAIRFLRFDQKLSLINIFLNKTLNSCYFSSLFLSELKIPISMDKSLEKRNRKKPIILEEKPIVTIISCLSEFPFAELSLGRTFFNEKEVFLVYSRKIDNSLESFDDIFDGAKKMLPLKHKNLLKIKDFYVISMEILFLYSGFYEDLSILQEKTRFPSSPNEVFQLLYETISSLEYLKLNKMFFFEITAKNILFDMEKRVFKLVNYEFENNISRNQFYFENRKIFRYLPPMAIIEQVVDSEEEEKSMNFNTKKPKLTSLNLDIHKSNVYSLGLSILGFAANEDLLSFNNSEDYEKILEILMKIDYPIEIKEILANMLNIDEDSRWDSWNLLNKLKDIKRNFMKKPDFLSLKDRVPIENAMIFSHEGFCLRYSREKDEVLKLSVSFLENPKVKFEVSNVISYCSQITPNSQLFYVFYLEKDSKSLNFYEGSFEKNLLVLKSLEKPFFLENSNNFVSLNSLISHGFLYIIGFEYQTAEAISFNKSLYCYDIMLNKWNVNMSIPEGIINKRSFVLFEENQKVFLLVKIKAKFKLFSYDTYKHVWEIKTTNFSKNIIENIEKFQLENIIIIKINNGLVGLFDVKKLELMLLDLEKCKIFRKKSVKDEGKEKLGIKSENFMQNDKNNVLFYKNFHRIGNGIACLSLWINEENEEIFMKRKDL